MSDSDGLFPAMELEHVDLVVDDRVEVGAGVNKRFRAFEPAAVMLVPPSLDEWLPQHHLSRFIADIVETQLDLKKFYASYAKTKGQPPYDPRLMVRVLLYGFCYAGWNKQPTSGPDRCLPQPDEAAHRAHQGSPRHASRTDSPPGNLKSRAEPPCRAPTASTYCRQRGTGPIFSRHENNADPEVHDDRHSNAPPAAAKSARISSHQLRIGVTDTRS